MKHKNLHWGWIVFWTIVFYPVGIYLIYQKTKKDRSELDLTSKPENNLAKIGWGLIIFGGGGFLAAFSEGFDFSILILSAVFMTTGFVSLKQAKKIKAAQRRYQQYVNILVNRKVKRFSELANIVQLPEDLIVADLEAMIDKKLLNSAYLDYGNRQVVINRPGEKFEEITRNCKSCGASNRIIKGFAAKCEYCNSYLD